MAGWKKKIDDFVPARNPPWLVRGVSIAINPPSSSVSSSFWTMLAEGASSVAGASKNIKDTLTE
jgi:hypothetical protein